MTYYILDAVTKGSPMVDMRLWIDDLSQYVTGSRTFVQKRLLQVITHTNSVMAEDGLRIAAKSVMLCSHHR
eukprot:5616576-Pyramimonas_sp.AAC.1